MSWIDIQFVWMVNRERFRVLIIFCILPLRLGMPCLIGFYQDINGTCVDCPPGTIGRNCCSESCSKGSYGLKCVYSCDCMDCDPVLGCLTKDTTFIGETVSPAEGPAHTDICLVLLIVILTIVGCNFAASMNLLWRFTTKFYLSQHQDKTATESTAQGLLWHIRAIAVFLAAYEVLGILRLTAAQGVAHGQSCTSALSSFAGIVCSGDAITGKVVHCVLDEHFQAGLVCVEWQVINAGRCPQYMHFEQHSGIGDFPCIGNELCPNKTYRSYEVNKYPACLNSSLYVNESTTAKVDTTEQPGSCNSFADKESNGQPMSCAVAVVIAVVVLVTLFCILMVWECLSGKSLLGLIVQRLKNVSCGRSTTGAVQVPQGEAEQPALEQLTSGQGSAAGTNHHQQV